MQRNRRTTGTGFSLLELLLAMMLVALLTSATWAYLRPAEEQARVISFVSDLQAFQKNIKKRFADVASAPYTWVNQITLRNDIPTNLQDGAGGIVSPWSTPIYVGRYALYSGGVLTDVPGSGFNITLVMPDDLTQRRNMCVPLVTALAPMWPQMSYINGVPSSSPAVPPGNVVYASDMPPTPAYMAEIIAKVCGQVGALTLVVADA